MKGCSTLKTITTADPFRYPRMTSQELRDSFLIEGLYAPGSLRLAQVDLERAIVGIAAPTGDAIPLPVCPELKAEYFTERRELGALNIGGPGLVRVGGSVYELNNLDLLYAGRGNPAVQFESKDSSSPAIFYLLSYPAHASYPTTLVRKNDAQPVEAGSAEMCNRRTIYKYVQNDGAQSCQLVMGVTELHSGSAWNTMPAHTHMRRSEIYFYFDLPSGARVFHMMGPPAETRHILVDDRQAIASPPWSIHAGVGTQAYKFCWGMGGENKDYSDMDPAPLHEMR